MSQFFNQTISEMEEFTDFIEEDIENVQRVLNEIKAANIDAEFKIHAKSETVEESAENVGIAEEEIVKTLIFIGDEPVAVLCPGDTSVSEEKLEDILETGVRMAKPEEVKDSTGYVVGGVSPFDLDIPVYMEESILEKENVKPAAGSRVVGVVLDPEELKEIAGAEARDLGR